MDTPENFRISAAQTLQACSLFSHLTTRTALSQFLVKITYACEQRIISIVDLRTLATFSSHINTHYFRNIMIIYNKWGQKLTKVEIISVGKMPARKDIAHRILDQGQISSCFWAYRRYDRKRLELTN